MNQLGGVSQASTTEVLIKAVAPGQAVDSKILTTWKNLVVSIHKGSNTILRGTASTPTEDPWRGPREFVQDSSCLYSRSQCGKYQIMNNESQKNPNFFKTSIYLSSICTLL